MIIQIGIQISKTDLKRIIKYFDDAETFYRQQKALRHKSRAWCIHQLNNKLKKKLV